jgi:succinate dehydrogenase hydrophobic anchor subunit
VLSDPPLPFEHRQGSWFVSASLPRRTTVLGPGDRIVSVDGDARAASVGPPQFMFFMAPGALFDLGVLRDGVERHVTLTVGAFPPNLIFPRTASFFLVSVCFFGMAMLMGLVRPDDPVTRMGCLAGLWTAWRMFYFAMMPFRIGSAGFAHVLGELGPALEISILPLGYHFFHRLAAIPGERFWTALRFLFYAVFGGVAALDLTTGLFRLQGRERALSLLDAYPTHIWSPMAVSLLRPFLVAPLAMCGVIVRGYFVNRDPGRRRRLRWVVIGVVGAVAPQVWMNVASILGVPYPLTIPQSNAFAALIPLTLAYAVLKHQVMGVQVIVRQGVKYLLARQVLTVALVLPAAALILPFARHPERSISETVSRSPMYFNVAALAAAAAAMKYRRQVRTWVDRRFFREAYSQEQILRELIERVAETPSLAEISRIVSLQVDAALHPRSIHVYYRANPSSGLTLGYSSIRTGRTPIPRDLPVSAILGNLKGPIDYPSPLLDEDRGWLDPLEPRLVVPISASRQQAAGIVVLGEKKSEEPYTAIDKGLLQALAAQMALACDNAWLQDRVEEEGRIRYEVLSKLDQSEVNLVRECPQCGACYDRSAAVCSTDGTALTLTIPVERVIDRRYRLESRIGRGGMGAVYDATDLRLNRNVAVKVMIGSLFGNPAALRRFRREARATATLAHANVVAIYDYGTVGAQGAYLVMERVPGTTWRFELDSRGALAPGVAARWFDQLLSGLEAAHDAGIVHRDLKPENVLVNGDQIKIVDFGLAKMRQVDDADTQSVTMAGTVLGTVGYMAPEQLMGRGTDERSDLFSAGVMAFEAVTGHRVFQGTHAEVLAAMLREDVNLPGGGPAVQRLNDVLRKSMAAQSEARYATAGAMRVELTSALAACPPIGIPRTRSPQADLGQTDTRSMGA